MNITEMLFELQDVEYADFQAKLTPNVARELFIGVRVPLMRKLAKKVYKDPRHEEFLLALPHRYYDENMMHGLLIAEETDFARCIGKLTDFLPYMDNWAVCDLTSPKVFKTHKPELLEKIKEWISDSHTYTIRFGVKSLMALFLDDDFHPDYLKLPANIRSEEYYVNMALAWFYATALTKQWDATIPYLETQYFDTWVHNKTIQKARESYLITPRQKQYLASLKIK